MTLIEAFLQVFYNISHIRPTWKQIVALIFCMVLAGGMLIYTYYSMM